MAKLTAKQHRTIQRALKGLFHLKSFLVPTSAKDVLKMDLFDRLSRELRLADNRRIYLSDAGLKRVETIVGAIDAASPFDELADYGEIWTECWRILETALSGGKEPENSTELVEMVSERVTQTIAVHTFAVPLFGVELDGIESLTLGSTRIVPSPLPHLESAGIKHEHARGEEGIDSKRPTLWLMASAHGTPRRAEKRFRERAELLVGMLAATAATVYQRGASALRIGVAMSGEAIDGRAVWFSWNDKTRSVTTHCNYGHGQDFKINGTLAETLTNTRLYTRAFAILESPERTELEDAIAKGVYWYSDAHRDPVPVMKLIKYWSAVETFFSSDNDKITHSVSVGLAGVLVYGGYSFVSEEEYMPFKGRVARLYNMRSRALHGASYDHVTENDVASLSKWVGQMLINMVSFVERGYTTVAQIRERTQILYEERLAATAEE